MNFSKVLSVCAALAESTVQIIYPEFKLAFEDNPVRLKERLVALGVDVEKLACSSCKTKIDSDLSNLGAVFKVDGELIVRCSNAKCALSEK